MQSLESLLSAPVAKAVNALFGESIDPSTVTFQRTNPQFEGDITLVVFPYVRLSKKGPEQTGQAIGEYLKANVPEIASFNVIKGFLNLVLSDSFWLNQFNAIANDQSFGTKKAGENSPFVMVEYSSPNTNKPLHLGHIRNNLLGYSVSELLKADGNRVMKVNLVNDRGIHICKSMLAWQKWGKGETPESSGMKGDHLVGKYYVEFDKALKAEMNPLLDRIFDENNLEGYSENQQKEIRAQLDKLAKLEKPFNDESAKLDMKAIARAGEEIAQLVEEAREGKISWKKVAAKAESAFEEQDAKTKEQKEKELRKMLKPLLDIEGKMEEAKEAVKDIVLTKTALMKEAQEMLRQWEAGNPEVRALWEKMNGWVYDGFGQSYKKLGVDFDKIYYESNTYLLGKEIIDEGLSKNVFVKRPDGAVIVDLTADGLDQKVLLRSDGTSVYITQDLGTAVERHKEFPFDKHIYVVGNEQEYHFKVLKLALKKLGYDWSDGLYHLSYGMVELPEGKMKSREGTVVDADDLIAVMENDAKELLDEKSKSENDRVPSMHHQLAQKDEDLPRVIGLAALKYFILKVDPKKKMLFNPKDSIQLTGDTGPFVQYTYARIKTILRKAEPESNVDPGNVSDLHEKEKQLIVLLNEFPGVIHEAATNYSPAVVANYVFSLAKIFNQAYDILPVLKETDKEKRHLRIALIRTIARTIKTAMSLLGIEVPERM